MRRALAKHDKALSETILDNCLVGGGIVRLATALAISRGEPDACSDAQEARAPCRTSDRRHSHGRSIPARQPEGATVAGGGAGHQGFLRRTRSGLPRGWENGCGDQSTGTVPSISVENKCRSQCHLMSNGRNGISFLKWSRQSPASRRCLLNRVVLSIIRRSQQRWAR